MKSIGKWFFLAGLALAVVAAFVDLWWLPWLVGGLGLVVGYLNVAEAEVKQFLLAGLGLTLALFVIEHQRFNPEWLTEIVFFERVFVSHALLLVGLLAVFKVAKD